MGMRNELHLNYVKMVRDFILKVKGLDMKSWLLSNHSASTSTKSAWKQFIPTVILQFGPQNDWQLRYSRKGKEKSP